MKLPPVWCVLRIDAEGVRHIAARESKRVADERARDMRRIWRFERPKPRVVVKRYEVAS